MQEGALFWRYIASSLDRLIACLDGLTVEELSWRPAAPGANSLYVLAAHMLGNAEENLLGLLGGQPMRREREAEFASRAEAASAGTLNARWGELRQRLNDTLTTLTPDALNQTYAHPRRGTITGRDVLIVVARHAAEHLGQAELTRDLLRARRECVSA
jgi:hypothetical protein